MTDPTAADPVRLASVPTLPPRVPDDMQVIEKYDIQVVEKTAKKPLEPLLLPSPRRRSRSLRPPPAALHREGEADPALLARLVLDVADFPLDRGRRRRRRAEAYRFTEDAVYLDDKGEPKEWAPNRYKIADILDALRAVGHLAEHVSTPSWTGGGVGPDPGEIVACANGLLHVTTRTLVRHDPRFFNQVSVPFNYTPDAPAPARWLEFLGELWPDDAAAVEALQEFFGYVVSARTDLQKIMLLIGPTRAGKGVIARVLKALVGAGNAAGPTLASLGTNFGLSPLIGKPLAIVSDARLGGGNARQIVERLLSVSGEDMLTIDRKYREPWTGNLQARFVVIANELPRFGDASGAIANRFIVLTVGQSWLGRENPGLTRELLGEPPASSAGRSTASTGSPSSEGHRAERSTPSPRCRTSPRRRQRSSATAARSEPTSRCPWPTCSTRGRPGARRNARDRPGTVQVFSRDLRAVVPGVRAARPRDGDNREPHYLGLALRTRTHNGVDRGPLRTGGVVLDGPQPNPLSSQDATEGGGSNRCDLWDHVTHNQTPAGAWRHQACEVAS